MANASKSNNSPDQSKRPPHQVRLPGFITAEEIGLGDVIKRATSYIGIKPSNHVVAARVGRRHSTAGWFSLVEPSNPNRPSIL